jgi:hypothetical protein
MAVYRSLKCLGFLIPGSPVDQGTSEGSSLLEREIALGRVIFSGGCGHMVTIPAHLICTLLKTWAILAPDAESPLAFHLHSGFGVLIWARATPRHRQAERTNGKRQGD